MANETFITVRGNAAKDPERRETRNGSWARFSMGVTARVRGDDGYVDRPTQWFEIRVYGTQADNVARSITKGCPVLVRGELRTDTWESEGEVRSMQYIRAETVALDLHFRSYSAGSASTPRQTAPEEAITTPESSENAWDTSPTAAVGYSAAPVA
ncbi:MAG: single-stranded DNA-binding protein [Ruaniaceae bacterium]|nr:single-stranded DNA-binding protein [Ruaniaceae bacterium]